VASKPAPNAKQPSAAAASNARGADSSSHQQQQQQQQQLPLLLGGQPLVPAMLNQIVLKFSPRRAAAISAPPSANGKLTMAQMMQLKKAATGAAAAEQEQEDAQVGIWRPGLGIGNLTGAATSCSCYVVWSLCYTPGFSACCQDMRIICCIPMSVPTQPLSAAAPPAPPPPPHPPTPTHPHTPQEFLQFLVDAAHEELVALRAALGLSQQDGAAGAAAAPEEDPEEWSQVVGKRNKTAVTRGGEDSLGGGRSVMSSIFRGCMKSIVKARTPTPTQPSITVQPFTMLHLDLGPRIRSIDDALDVLTASEAIHGGYRRGGGGLAWVGWVGGWVGGWVEAQQ
jgi:hypothetical protein